MFQQGTKLSSCFLISVPSQCVIVPPTIPARDNKIAVLYGITLNRFYGSLSDTSAPFLFLCAFFFYR